MADQGIDTFGVDINDLVVKTIKTGNIHIKEPGLPELVKENIANGKLEVETESRVSDVYLVVVPTPFKEKNEPDISYVKSATKSILPLLKEGDLYVIESTSPVGTTESMAQFIFEERPDLNGKISIAYCPERVL